MARFGRRRRSDGDDADQPADDAEVPAAGVGEGAGEEAGEQEAEPVAQPRPEGPWDLEDLPSDDGLDRVDLGALRVPVPEGVELRVDLDPQGAVVAATLVHGEDVMQLGVFAAPRTEPLWDEVREEIATSLAEGGGGASTEDGPYGVELQGRVPTDQPDSFAAARFVGVNGPRWFLRALLSGPAVAAGQVDEVLAGALRGVVVVRGADAMPPREPLPMRLPKEAQVSAEEAIAAQQAAEAQQQEESRTLPPLAERGPETTETA